MRPLLGGETRPSGSLSVVLQHSQTHVVHEPEGLLSFHVPPLRAIRCQPSSFFVVRLHTVAKYL